MPNMINIYRHTSFLSKNPMQESSPALVEQKVYVTRCDNVIRTI